MARDLIPPSSPAGRPSPDAPPRLIELPPEPARSAAEPAMQPPPAPSKYRNRFGFLMGALAGVFIAAALILVAVVVSSGSEPAVDDRLATNFSKWQPTEEGPGAAAQIASRVGAKYRNEDGTQLVAVEPQWAPELKVRVRSGGIADLEGDGVLYRLNGLGQNGSIPFGKPSGERLRVLQREGLELALYTFRYVPDVDMVMVILPPAPPAPTPTATTPGVATPTPTPTPKPMALFFRPGDLLAQLQVPLGDTVPPDAPTPETLDPAESDAIAALTNSNRFNLSLQGPDLVLDRVTGP